MRKLDFSPSDEKGHDHILFLSRDSILGMDLKEALSARGLPPAIQLASVDNSGESGISYCAVVVDLGKLDGQTAVSVQPDAFPKVPLLVIADTCDSARSFGVDEDCWFIKPVSTDDVATRLGELLRKAGFTPRHLRATMGMAIGRTSLPSQVTKRPRDSC